MSSLIHLIPSNATLKDESAGLHRLLAAEQACSVISKCLRTDEEIEFRLQELCKNISDTLKLDAASACLITGNSRKSASFACAQLDESEREFVSRSDLQLKIAAISESGVFIDSFSNFATIFSINCSSPSSLAIVGIFSAAVLCGFICAMDFSPGRSWDSQDERIMAFAAEELGLAKARFITLESLKEANEAAIKKAEELEKSLGREKELNALQADFIATASHEFKTPLAIIDSAAQLLIGNKSDEISYRRRQVEKIRSAVGRMSYLVEKTLELSAAEAEKIKCELNPVELVSLVTESTSRFADMYPKRRIKFSMPNSKMWVHAEEKLLDQVLTNAIGNALKYSHEDSEISVEITQELNCAAIYISDQGIGIHPDDLGRMFSKFARGRNTIHTAGSGIGLYICDKFIRLMGGNFFIASELNEGTVVKICLPITNPEE